MAPKRGHFTMKIKPQELSYCFDKTAEITEQYVSAHIGSDDPQKSVNNFISTCEKYLCVKIRKRRSIISSEKKAIWGVCIDRTNGDFDVYFANNLNECWERFVVCKEVFHVVLARDEYRNMDIFDHIEAQLSAELPGEHAPGLSNVAETLSEIAAMEFLLPYQRRTELIHNASGEINYQAIAERYKVPRVFVEKYMSDALMKFVSPYCRARLFC